MLGLSPQEMLIVLVIGVLLFGKNLPNIGRTLGKGLMEFKKGISDLKAEVDIASYANSTPSSSTSRVESRYTNEDFDEPTAPKFEPPTQAPTVAATPTAASNGASNGASSSAASSGAAPSDAVPRNEA